MKRLYNFFVFFILIFLVSCSSSRNYAQSNYEQGYSSQPAPITYQQFYDGLSPYGSWVNYQDYGYVWVPNVPGFRPYYNDGHWVYTNYGWTWVSDYNWGWAPFHYGRWTHDMAFGWMWVPGYEWGPAWVSWRGGGDYYGWAPLSPGMGINISMGSMPYNYWNFVPRRYINSPRINNYYVNQSKNVTIINNTTIINNNNTTVINRNNNINRNRPVYNSGPSVADVEKSTRMKIRQFNVVESNKPGTAQINNNSIKVYRPTVKEESVNSANTKPARVFNTQELEANRRKDNVNRPTIPQQPYSQTGNNKIISPNTSTPQKIREFNEAPNENRNQENRNQPKRPINNTEGRPPINGNNELNPRVKNDAGLKNNTPANIPSRQPVRAFNNEEKPSINNRPNVPVENTPPVNKPQGNIMTQPQRQLQNNTPVYKEHQPVSHQRNMRMETVRPAQHVVQEPQPERQVNEKK